MRSLLAPLLLLLASIAVTDAQLEKLAVDNNTKPCPDGWKHMSRLDECYLLADVFLPWNSASNFCNGTVGGALVSLLSQMEYDLVLEWLLPQMSLFPVWTGLYAYTNGLYRWTDGHRYNSSHWAPKEPQDTGTDVCFAWKTDDPSGYRSMACKYAQPFVCKQHAANCPSTHLNGTSGNFSSSNYPDNYDNGLDCYYHITVPAGKAVRLTILDYDVEPTYDYVKIYDGKDNNAYILANLTSNLYQINKTIESTGNEMTVYFHTDFAYAYRGWLFHYEAVDTAGIHVFNKTRGTITSPNYPGQYDNNLIEFYQIVQPSNKIVLLHVMEFVTELTYDFLRIIDGPDFSDESAVIAVLSGNLTGTTLPSFESKKNVLSMVFHTDASRGEDGWKVTYSSAPKL